MPLIETNAIKKDGKWICPECENDTLKFSTHLDADNYYINTYDCTKCNKYIYFKCDRN